MKYMKDLRRGCGWMVLSLFVAFSGVLQAAAGAPAAEPAKEGISPFIPLILIFAVFYFLLMRPQQRRQKQQQKFVSELKKGDMVITNSGIIGTIRTLSDKFVTLEVDDGVCIKILRNQILESANSLKEDKGVARKEVTT